MNAACLAVHDQLLRYVALPHCFDRRSVIDDTEIVVPAAGFRVPVSSAAPGKSFDETREYHHPPTEDLDENGQGNCHTAFAFVAHRAVVDVDPDLGLVKVSRSPPLKTSGGRSSAAAFVGQWRAVSPRVSGWR